MNIDPHAAPEPIAFERTSRELGVVVGFDGSTQSILALHFGALEAQRSGRELTVVTAFTIPVQVYSTLAALPEGSDATHALEAASIVLNDARRYLEGYPGKSPFAAPG
ncbi:universal stress protein [Nesterenkonia pannonica]|uniref:universal stress protein n=1 Tax=Nesterenkonia pannonica TaxID=1548602 RepID=UPI0021646D6A|nr:universal stress protein [Nesterenkonia pannonica]